MARAHSAFGMLKRKKESGSRFFESQYQQNPVAEEGNLIKAAWFNRYDAPPREFEKIVCALDCASKLGVRNDRSAIVTIGVTANAFYVLDVVRDKVEFPQLVRMAHAVFERHSYKKHEPDGSTVLQRPSALYVKDVCLRDCIDSSASSGFTFAGRAD